jgi:phenylacetate-CoA ligase
MSAFGRLLMETGQVLRRSRSLNILREIDANACRSREKIVEDQFQRLSWLLTDAETHVPYYRDMFRQIGIKSSDIRNFNDFSLLPILTKSIIKERGKDLVRQDLQNAKLRKSHSGGSTGVPLTFYHGPDYDDFAEAITFRQLSQCGWRIGDTIAYVWGGSDRFHSMPHWRRELTQTFRRRFQFDPFYSGDKDLGLWWKKWQRVKPVAVFGYASTIARFAAYIKAKGGYTSSSVKGVFTTAEKLYYPQRQAISRIFGCSVYDCYGSSEIRGIAAECSKGRMHVNADSVVLEVDRSGAAPGEIAPFIATSLRNAAMPFIRYRNEDCGRLLTETCDCGNNFPLMDLDIARITDNFIMPTGQVVHGEFFTHLMYGSTGIDSFQFHQVAADSIVLWIVPSSRRADDRDQYLRNVVNKIRALDPTSNINVEVRMTEAIPLSPAGKHRFVRSEVANLALSPA